MKNRDVLLGLIQDMEDFARIKKEKCPPIYLLGGSGCIIADYFERGTLDIDLLDMDYPSRVGKLFRLLGSVDILDKYLTTVAWGFEKRAKKLEQFDYLDIFVLSVEDIIVTKIGRYSKKDREDIGKLLEHADRNLVNYLIDNVSKRIDISTAVLKEFLENAKFFRSDFNV